ncbi:MAG: exonuclease domain-containing protein [Desulfobacterales bacterium]|jgi:DNA polymerase-3 subunit epsilon|nr:exonuclease domain-containing protein [Desulfobacterales bacterium]
MPRLKHNTVFGWFVLVCILFFTAVVVSFSLMLWQELSDADRQVVLSLIGRHGSYLFGAGVLLLAGLGFAIDWVFRLYVLPLDKITEETKIIYRANPAHRIRVEGSRDVVRLAGAINAAADRFEELQRSVEERIADARVRIEEEKNILSAVLADLPEGVVICNAEGQITLYNQRARKLLEDPETPLLAAGPLPAGGFLGLGRSIFSVVEKPVITHALKDLPEKLRSGRQDLTASFVMVARNQLLLQAAAVPILSPLRELTGFVLILTDFTGRMEFFLRMDALLQTLSMEVRGALASVRSAVEVILEYPDLSAPKRDEFNRIIHREALSAGAAMDRLRSECSALIRTPVSLSAMRLRDLLDALRVKADAAAGLMLSGEPVDDRLWVKVDSYSLTLAVIFVLKRLGAEFGTGAFRWALAAKAPYLGLDFIWGGPLLKLELLRRWEQQAVTVGDETLNATLKEILARHGAELWPQPSADAARACVRLLLEAAEPPALPVLPRRRTILATARPVYYDFDLFNQAGQSPELDDRPLAELAYTVFDTETTGLEIRAGDEMVALGAVRIVNGRLLESECFDHLVQADSPLNPASIRIHGIQPEMLAGQPDVGQVLDLFHRFAEGTILVAHNAAFDMRLLQLQERRTGIRFENPVLDTMLLSAVVHPAQEKHDLESIAERLGIIIMGRHTALGDAIGTAEIFLKLLPLLAESGIRTLRQARDAARNTYYARLKY